MDLYQSIIIFDEDKKWQNIHFKCFSRFFTFFNIRFDENDFFECTILACVRLLVILFCQLLLHKKIKHEYLRSRALIYVCDFHHHFLLLIFIQIWPLSRYSCFLSWIPALKEFFSIDWCFLLQYRSGKERSPHMFAKNPKLPIYLWFKSGFEEVRCNTTFDSCELFAIIFHLQNKVVSWILSWMDLFHQSYPTHLWQSFIIEGLTELFFILSVFIFNFILLSIIQNTILSKVMPLLQGLVCEKKRDKS